MKRDNGAVAVRRTTGAFEAWRKANAARLDARPDVNPKIEKVQRGAIRDLRFFDSLPRRQQLKDREGSW